MNNILQYMNFSPVNIMVMVIFLFFIFFVTQWITKMRKQQVDIVGNRNTFFVISGVVILICLGSLAVKGLNLGLDFTGGTVMEIGTNPDVSTSDMESYIKQFAQQIQSDKFNNPKIQRVADTETSQRVIQPTSTPQESEDFKRYGDETETALPTEEVTYRRFIIQTKELSSEEVQNFKNFLKSQLGEIQDLKTDTIGPVIGQELTKNALIAIIITLVAQLLYITFRFGSQFRFGIATDIALLHDVIVMVGMYSLIGHPADSPFLAALLTIVGYSVMDTVVVFDRIRENLKLMKEGTYGEIINLSLNQTLTRTAATTLTTLLSVFALYYFGGDTLKDFALALFIGIAAGTYSSIFIASPLLLLIDDFAKKQESKRVAERRKRLEEEARMKGERKLQPKTEEETKKDKGKILREDYPTPEETPQVSQRELTKSGQKSQRKRRR